MLQNVTTKKMLASKVRCCVSVLEKGSGLMFRRKLQDAALVFPFADEQRRALHMLFVFFPIDVLFLDNRKQVVEKATLFPFTLYAPKKAAQYVIELPRGKGTAVSPGDKLAWT